MATVREQVITNFIAAFETGVGDPFEGFAKERNSDRPTKAFDLLVFQDGPQVASHDSAGITLYTMSATVEGYAEAASAALLGAALSALYGDIVAAATADHTLGGYAVDVREVDMDPSIERDGSKFVGMVSVGFDIDFMTRERDPSTLAP